MAPSNLSKTAVMRKRGIILAIVGLIVVILTVGAYLLIQQKEVELTDDLFVNTNAFAELTAPDVVEFYNLYLAEQSFVYFNREIQQVFQKNNNFGMTLIELLRCQNVS